MTRLARIAAVAALALAWLVLGLPALGMACGVRAPPPWRTPGCAARPDPALLLRDGSWREQVGGLIHVHLRGDTAAIGYAQGVLVGDRVARIEHDLMGEFVRRVPSFWGRHLILGLVNFNNRALSAYLQPRELQEIAAITAGHQQAHDCYRGMSPSYARGLEYHALHDVSQYLIDNPLVHPPQVGCTAVAVAGVHSVDGHLRVGRLFDFEGGTCFDVDKVVYTVAPDHGHRFVSVSWGGMAGAVTGMNDARLWVSINAAATSGRAPGHGWIDAYSGRPIVLVVRQILQDCATLAEAEQVLARSPVFVSDAVLLASGAEGRAEVVEKGPRTWAVRPMRDGLLVATNHFLEPAWGGDRANNQRISDGTTSIRYARALELLAERPVQDCASLLTLLRDHRGLHDAAVGFGNRSTLNAWIGAHLVVADVTAGIVWVCEPLHGLGVARAFDWSGPRADCGTLPADPELRFMQEVLPRYEAIRDRCQAALAAGRHPTEAEAQALLALNPQSAEAWGIAAAAATSPPERARRLARAASLQPAYRADRDAIAQALATAAP